MHKGWIEKWGKGEPLNRGGQGDTFVVPSRSEPKGVLKILKESKKTDPKARRRMIQEINNLTVLSSAGAKVPKVLDHNSGDLDDISSELYFVMEYIPGETLATAVSSTGGFAIQQSIGICIALCETLKVVIQEKIVHRDLKQENIIIRNLENFDLIVLDFGISFRAANEANLTDHQETFQNSLIRLPERTGIGENKRDFRSDLTDVCAILYFCLTNQPPRNLKDSHGNSPHRNQQVQSILEGKTKGDTQLNLLNAFFDKAFNPDIDLRWQVVEELEGRLREILENVNHSAPEPLSSVVARSRDALRKSDHKTRMVEFRREIERQIGNLESNLYQIIGPCDPFYIVPMDSSSRSKENYKLDRLYMYRLRVGNGTHDLELQTQYDFSLAGTECTVRRSIVSVNNPKSAETPQEITVIEPAILVARYNSPESYPLAAITDDMHRALGRAVELLTTQIIRTGSEQIEKQQTRSQKPQESTGYFSEADEYRLTDNDF